MRRTVLTAVSLALLAACADRPIGPREPIVVTADWLNRSLTVFSQQRLTTDGPVADAILARIDLSAWPPGPLEVELTPDGRTAIVAIGPGFYQSGSTNLLVGSPDVPSGSAILVVDLPAHRVVADLRPRHAPMGIAVTPDGRRAYTANYGGSGAAGDSVSVIDITGGRILAEFSVGGRPEQIAIDPTGEVAIVNLVDAGGVRLFRLDDPPGTLSEVVGTGDDPSGMAFLGGPTRAIVANSLSTDFALLDTSDPGAAFVLQTVRISSGVPYGVTTLDGPDRKILAPTGVPATLVVLAQDGDTIVPSAPVRLTGQPFPMNAVADEHQRFAFIPHMSTRGAVQLSVVDLSTGAVRGVRWLEASGPAYVAAWP